MLRALHRWPGLLALALLLVLSVSGAALSVFPAAQRLAAPQAEAGLTVATLAARVEAVHPGVEQILRAPSGRITAYWFDGGTPGAAVIDPATGGDAATADPNPVERWLTNLHRSLFLGNAGRVVMAVGAAAMLVLAATGAGLVARRAGGWRRWFAPMRGPLAGRIHVEMARVAVVGLALSSATALWMTVSTFGLLPDSEKSPPLPAGVSGETGMALDAIKLLSTTDVADLRELTFPYPDDRSDVFTLKTDRGVGYIDQGSGALLAWAELSGWQKASETIYMLHTGNGAAVLGLALGLAALGVPLLGATGFLLWFASWRGRPRIRGNASVTQAGTILLVGSESGTTWSFAATLHAALTAAGESVHAAPMSAFDPARYARARRIVVLAATYGDGDAPASARAFLDRLQGLRRPPEAPLAVLGFGDRAFSAYCAFAHAVEAAAEAKGWARLLPLETVNRQSPQDFACWGRTFGRAIGIDLELVHQPVVPASRTLTLVSRRDYGDAVQAPTAILRFAAPRAPVWSRLIGRGFGRFRPGDLLGVLPEGSALPRFYSLASDSRDGFIEIVVRRLPGGLCSGQLTALEPGQAVQAFLRPNPAFWPDRGRTPLVLIGAGTGVAPLAGFVRGNARRRPIHLFFGMRHPESDFLYDSEFHGWLDDGRLAALFTAVSRGPRPHYVQEALRANGAEIARLIGDGARIMVCGGREMAAGVSEALAEILAPTGPSLAELKVEGRYAQDVF
jgi:sulfite reductase (NADPH) flavoprotein alpha-component